MPVYACSAIKYNNYIPGEGVDLGIAQEGGPLLPLSLPFLSLLRSRGQFVIMGENACNIPNFHDLGPGPELRALQELPGTRGTRTRSAAA